MDHCWQWFIGNPLLGQLPALPLWTLNRPSYCIYSYTQTELNRLLYQILIVHNLVATIGLCVCVNTVFARHRLVSKAFSKLSNSVVSVFAY